MRAGRTSRSVEWCPTRSPPDARPYGGGRARVGRAIGKAPHPDHAPTGVIRQDVPTAVQVFVDPSGARRRRLRVTMCAIGILLVLALVVIWVSQLSGPAGPPHQTPCPTARSAEACAR